MRLKGLFGAIAFISMLTTAFLSVSAQSPIELHGEVVDQNNAVIVNAEISLRGENGINLQTVGDARGEFRFRNLSKGTFTLRAFAKGFGEHEQKIEIGAVSKLQISVVLYPVVKEKVDIDQNSDALAPEASTGLITLSRQDLDAFSNDPDQFREQLEQLAASSGGEPGKANVTVDGLRNDGRLPSKSAISQVRINPNPYSAEYQTTPRGGEIEITTKPGGDVISGSAFFNYNGTKLNARDPFAARRAETQRKHYGINIGGPIVKDKSGYFFDLETRNIDDAAAINGFVLDDNLQIVNRIFNFPKPQRLLNATARADWLINKSNTLVLSYNLSRNDLFGQGIGGTNLAERRFDETRTENNFRLSEIWTPSARVVNELRIGFAMNAIRQAAASNEIAIDVAGAFSSGGANLQSVRRNEKILQIVNHTTFDVGKHRLKFGVQIFNNRIRDRRAENTNGMYFFGGTEISDGQTTVSISSLEQYRRTLLGLSGGVPTRFDITVGDSTVSINQWTLGGFLQEEWKIHPKVQLSFGIRYEAQTVPNDSASLAPRIGIAYTPDKKQNWVLRARAGIYYERIEPSLTLESERLDGIRQRQITIDSPLFPDPFINGVPAGSVPTIRILGPRLRPPASAQIRLEVDRRLPKWWQLRASYSWLAGWSELRARNINAPLVDAANPDPGIAPRPFGTDQNVLQFESTGRTEGTAFFVGLSQFRNKRFSLNVGYLYLDYRTDSDGPFSLPQSSYDFAGEWGRTSSQSNHRVFSTFRLNLPLLLRLSASLNASSGRHFNITTGRDNNGDGNLNDRPDVTSTASPGAISTRFGVLNPNVINGNLERNSGLGPVFVALNLNLSRTFGFGKKDGKGQSPYDMTATISANNVLNRSNLTGNVGVVSSPLFGFPTYAFPARQIELGLRLNF